jgi:hypothetical protein
VELKALLGDRDDRRRGLTVAVVALATNDDRSTSATSWRIAAAPVGNTRYNGGSEECTRELTQSSATPGIRYSCERAPRSSGPVSL